MSVHYVLLSYLLDMYVLQLSQLVPLHYRHGFHSRLANLNKLLRYSLGGYRPSKTTHQILSLYVFAVQIRIYIFIEWYFTCGSMPPERNTSNPPIYATQQKHILNIKL